MFNLLICYCQISGENIASFNIWASGRTISGEYLAVYGGEYLENIWDYLYNSTIFVHLGHWEKNIWRISSCLWGEYPGKYLRISIQFQPFLSIWATGTKISGEYIAVCVGEYLRISIQFQPFLSSLVRSSSSLCLFLVTLEEAVRSCS